jgi:hypothetical protein
MPFVAIIVAGFGRFVVVEKEGVVGVSEDDVLAQEGGLEEGVVTVYLFEDVVVAVDEAELAVALAARLEVETQGVLGHQHVVASQLVNQPADILQIRLRYFALSFEFLDGQSQFRDGGAVQREGLVDVEVMALVLQGLLDFSAYLQVDDALG